ncbi:MAG TPA: hypothetical protein VFH39_02960 [Candidatus Saccharimonadales bacterium]|nr:hypothetical protein [Candidatus Saccharimonadales bacterium]
MRVRGFPFGYSATTGDDTATCMNAADPIYAYHPVTASFQTASVWFDLIVYGVVLTAAYLLIDQTKVRT